MMPSDNSEAAANAVSISIVDRVANRHVDVIAHRTSIDQRPTRAERFDDPTDFGSEGGRALASLDQPRLDLSDVVGEEDVREIGVG